MTKQKEITSNQLDKTEMLNIRGVTYTKSQFLSVRYENSVSLLPSGLAKKELKQIENEKMKEIAEKLRKWDFSHPLNASILSNQNGIGKTHIAVCIFKRFLWEWLLKNFKKNVENMNKYYYDSIDELSLPDAQWIAERELLGKIQETFNSNYSENSEQEILKKMCNRNFLVIDDIFGNRNNEFSKRILLHILDERSEYQGKATLITSNLCIEEIASIDTRIASRIDNSLCFQIESKIKDFRKNF